MSVWILKVPSKGPAIFHPAQCAMVRTSPELYKQVTVPPPGYARCSRYGPCKRVGS